jgi:hypothetical protein
MKRSRQQRTANATSSNSSSAAVSRSHTGPGSRRPGPGPAHLEDRLGRASRLASMAAAPVHSGFGPSQQVLPKAATWLQPRVPADPRAEPGGERRFWSDTAARAARSACFGPRQRCEALLRSDCGRSLNCRDTGGNLNLSATRVAPARPGGGRHGHRLGLITGVTVSRAARLVHADTGCAEGSNREHVAACEWRGSNRLPIADGNEGAQRASGSMGLEPRSSRRVDDDLAGRVRPGPGVRDSEGVRTSVDRTCTRTRHGSSLPSPHPPRGGEAWNPADDGGG